MKKLYNILIRLGVCLVGCTSYIDYIFDGQLVDNDVPGNILYGFIGKAFGIPDTILYMGAGYAQLSAGTSKREWLFISYGDDPIDQTNIKRGIDYYNKLFKK